MSACQVIKRHFVNREYANKQNECHPKAGFAKMLTSKCLDDDFVVINSQIQSVNIVHCALTAGLVKMLGVWGKQFELPAWEWAMEGPQTCLLASAMVTLQPFI
jgi:hypothetical protein